MKSKNETIRTGRRFMNPKQPTKKRSHSAIGFLKTKTIRLGIKSIREQTAQKRGGEFRFVSLEGIIEPSFSEAQTRELKIDLVELLTFFYERCYGDLNERERISLRNFIVVFKRVGPEIPKADLVYEEMSDIERQRFEPLKGKFSATEIVEKIKREITNRVSSSLVKMRKYFESNPGFL